MRIAYFTDTYKPQVNGVTFVVAEHSKILAQRHGVKIYAPAYELGHRDEVEGKVEVERYPSISLPTYKEVNLPLVQIKRLEESVVRFGPEIIHFHSPGPMGLSAMKIAREMKVPLVGTYHSLFSEILPRLPISRWVPRNWIWHLSRRVFEKCDLVISPSGEIKRQMEAHGHKVRIEVVSNGIDTAAFLPKKRYGGKKAIFVGRVSHEKNIDVVVRVFGRVVKALPEATFAIVGDGPAREELEKLVGSLGLGGNINFLGYVKREILGEYYRGADVFVTASEMEVQPVTILEAMACGLPVVGVSAAGVVDMVEEGKNGFLVKSGETSEMAEKIIETLATKTNEKLGRNARRWAEENDVRVSVSKIEKLYNELI